MDGRDTTHPPSDPPPARMASVPPGLAAGMTVAGKYELLRKLGTGAMGEVWAARHRTLDEEVAIKLVMRGVDNGDGTSAESRFLLEARVAAMLSRKTRHIVAVTDHGQDGALGYLVMELLEGEPLDARIARTGPLPIAKVVPLVIQIARGLSIAHGDGVTHRDLKPSNIFVTVDEEGNALAKVLDFGIAKLRRGDRSAAFDTKRGFLLGTPAYMSPEQARGKQVDHRADVWALAVITYHMLTGEFPFDAESGDELFARIIRVHAIPIRDRRPELPAIVEDFFARAFAKRLEDRFQSALSLAGAFEQLEPLVEGKVLSLPPPPALAIINDEFELAGVSSRKGKRGASSPPRPDPSLFIAGLPPKRRIVSPLIAGLVVGAVLALTGVVLSVYFEREPVAKKPAVLVGPPVAVPAAREIPAPAAPAEVTPAPARAPDDGPTNAPRVLRRPAHPAATVANAEPPVVPPPVVAPPIPAPAPVPAPAAKTAKRDDKSEIF
jgi:eukaryotic-like serine/threonine-protein kinase